MKKTYVIRIWPTFRNGRIGKNFSKYKSLTPDQAAEYERRMKQIYENSRATVIFYEYNDTM